MSDYLNRFTRLPRIVAIVCGCGSISNNRNAMFRVLYMLYSGFLLLIPLFGIVRSLTLIRWTGSFEARFACTTLYLAWCLQSMYSALFFIYHSRRGNFKKFEKLWRETRCDQLISESKFSKYAYYWTVPAFGYVIIYVVTSFILALLPHLGIMPFPWPEDFVPYKPLSVYFTSLLLSSAAMFWILPQYWYFVISLLFRYAWVGLTVKIQKPASVEDGKMGAYPSVLNFVTIQHRQLSEIMDRMNDLYGIYALALMATGIPAILMQLYLVSQYTGTVSSMFSMIFWLFGNLVQVLLIFSASMIHTAAKGVVGAVYNRYIDHYIKFLQQMDSAEHNGMEVKVPFGTETSIILEQLRASDVKLTACGWFDVTRSVFVTLISVLATYYLVLVQFAQPVSNSQAVEVNQTAC